MRIPRMTAAEQKAQNEAQLEDLKARVDASYKRALANVPPEKKLEAINRWLIRTFGRGIIDAGFLAKEAPESRPKKARAKSARRKRPTTKRKPRVSQ